MVLFCPPGQSDGEELVQLPLFLCSAATGPHNRKSHGQVSTADLHSLAYPAALSVLNTTLFFFSNVLSYVDISLIENWLRSFELKTRNSGGTAWLENQSD